MKTLFLRTISSSISLRVHVALALLLFVLAALNLSARTLRVGVGASYTSISAAAQEAVPGDTILVLEGTYSGGQFVSDLRGRSDDPIVILAEPGKRVVIEGGTQALHLSDVAWLHIVGFEFTGQTGNGVNIDDGGSFDTPSHHVIVEDCFFHDMNATGNNDLLKLSGLDSFQIRNCRFLNGAAGGSGADMVGCHNGVFFGNRFENMGSNCIQAKGGTQFIRIERNSFINGGQRGINLGGSTGLQFFRPLEAPFEAADMQVFSNVFVGAVTPVAFVGCVRVEVVNNTIWKPEKWVTRILQETVDPDRFLSCGDNLFRNNIVVIDGRVTTDVNIGPNTRPESFRFDNNLWYHTENPSWSGPNLPVSEEGGVIGENPNFANPDNEDFTIDIGSPAVGKGRAVEEPLEDALGRRFNTPRSVGAVEGNPPTMSTPAFAERNSHRHNPQIHVAPNPAINGCVLSYQLAEPAQVVLELFNERGELIRRVVNQRQGAGKHQQQITSQPESITLLVLLTIDGEAYSTRIASLNASDR